MAEGVLRIGTMGWTYADWQGVFYPPSVSAENRLKLYASTLGAVEIDSTFYACPRESVVETWGKITPQNFVFCPKVPRSLTHDRKLQNVWPDLQQFVAVMRRLGPKLGPVLLQLGPGFTREDWPALRTLIPLLPTLAPTRFVLEVRHRSLLQQSLIQFLHEHHVALAAADYALMPRQFTTTTDFAYIRLIGRHGQFEHINRIQQDRSSDLDRWAEAIRKAQAHTNAVYVFVNNDYEGYSPGTCSRLMERLGTAAKPEPGRLQGILFDEEAAPWN